MLRQNAKAKDSYDFSTKKKVSIWVSKYPYADIPDDYFEETLFKKGTRATNTWSDNYCLTYFRPDNLETNGSYDELVSIEEAASACSFSSSYLAPLLSKARKKNISEISWIILLFEVEYSIKKTAVEKDEFTTFLGAFTYDENAENASEEETPMPEEKGFKFNK